MPRCRLRYSVIVTNLLPGGTAAAKTLLAGPSSLSGPRREDGALDIDKPLPPWWWALNFVLVPVILSAVALVGGHITGALVLPLLFMISVPLISREWRRFRREHDHNGRHFDAEVH